jgi:hypothetical protein
MWPMRFGLTLFMVLSCGSLGCVRAGALDGTACQVNAGMHCYDLTSMKQQPGGPPAAADESRTLADGRPSNPPSGPIMTQMRPGLYEFLWPTNVYVVTPGPVQHPPSR